MMIMLIILIMSTQMIMLILMQVMITEDAKYDDGVVQEAVVEKFVKYFKAIFHHNSWYFGYFVTCEQKMENFTCYFIELIFISFFNQVSS